LLTSKQILLEHGFTRSADFFTYTFNKFNDVVRDVSKYYSYACAGFNKHNPYPLPHRLMLTRVSADGLALDQAKAQIDACENYKTLLILY